MLRRVIYCYAFFNCTNWNHFVIAGAVSNDITNDISIAIDTFFLI